MFTYPSRDIDKPGLLLSYLGSTWAATYRNEFQLRKLMQARGRLEYQRTLNLGEAVDTVGRLNMPVLHAEHWYQLSLLESELNSAEVTTLRYGDAAVYGSQTDGVMHYYGAARPTRYAWQIPAEIRSCPFIFNRMHDATLVYADGADYFLDSINSAVVFRQNPFDNELVPKQDIYQDGEVVDREIHLWVFRAQLEQDYVYTHFGYLLGLQLPSTDAYLSLVNAVLDGTVEGTARSHIDKAIAAITDVPVVREDGEIVQHVTQDNYGWLVATDKNIYRFSTGASVIVAQGDVVNAGQQLADTVTFYEFGRGQVPEALLAIELGRGFLTEGFMGGIVFENKSVPLEVSSDGIFTRVEFEVGGWPGDVIKFWDDFHARGIDNPPTLAQLLDQRTNKVGEPAASNLPTTINPLQFLAENVLRNNAFAVRIKVSDIGENALDLSHIRQLRRLVPPHTAMLVIMELETDDEFITMDGPGDEDGPGYSEDPGLGLALEPIEETITASDMITENPRLAYVDGACI